MKFVSESTLESVIERFDAMNEDEEQEVLNDMAEKQPAVVAYSLAMREDFDEQEDFWMLLHMIVIIWMAFREEYDTIPTVTDEEVLAKDDAIQEEADHLATLSEEEREQVLTAKFVDQSQPELMGFIVGQIMDMQDEEDLTDDAAAALHSNLSLIVELLDEALNKPQLRMI